MKWLAILLVMSGLSACNGNGSSTTISLDSAGKKLKPLENKVDSAASRLMDTAKKDWKELKNKIGNKLIDKDSVHK